MEGSSWRPAQGEASMAGDASSVDWRTQLQPEARQRIVNKIMETLKRHLPISVPEGLNELKKIAVRFEEKIYTAATSQSDYLRRISLKMLSMETKAQPSNAGAVNQNPADPGSVGIQSQANNPGQPLPVPNRQSLLPQSIQNNTSAAPALPSLSGLSQSMSGVTQASNMQNMPGISQNSVNNSADMYVSAQRQQQQILSQQQQQQPQNQLLYQRHLQQHMLKKKLQQQQQQQQHSSLMQPHMQQQQQQLPPGQLQSSLQSNQSNIQQTQAANTQLASQSGLQQNQLNPIQQPTSSLLQQNPQSVGRQQQPQQTPLQQQSMSISHQSALSQPHQLMGQQGNIPSMQQTQLLGQQNNMADMQQQQPRLPSIQQNNLLSMQQQHQILNQQTVSLHQQQQQQQQQLGSQSHMAGMQQQQQHQLLGSLPNVSNMQPHQRALIMQKNATQQQQQQQQQPQQSSLALSQSQGQGQQSQHQSSQQQLMSQFQSPPPQLQQQMIMQQQQSNSLQREMQQRLVSGNLLQSQNAMDQKQFIQQQRGLPEVSSSTSMDSTAQTGHAGVIDAQEESYQKIKSMKELYFTDLSEFHQKIAMKVQQQEQLLPPGKQSEQFDRLRNFKGMLERMLTLLQLSKNNIPPNLKEKLMAYEKQMQNLVVSHRTKKIPQGQQPPQFQHANVGNSQPIITQQQQSSQITQLQMPDNHQNSVQQINLPGPSLQSGGASSMQHMSMPLPTTQQNLSNTMQPNSNVDSVQVNSFNSGQPGAIGSGHQGGIGSLQNSMSTPQQTSSNTLSQSTVNTLQASVGSMQPGSNILQQQQQLKQEQQQQLKQQFHNRHMQHPLLQHQQRQMLQPQQQPLLQQQKQQQQQQTSQLPVHQVQQQQVHSINDLSEMKVRQGSGMKTGIHEYPAGQRLNYYSQQLKQGAAFPVSSPQNLQALSPQISHHSSPQIDPNGLLSSIPKVKAPLQSATSPLVVTPSTPFAASPIPADSEKPIASISSSVVHQQSSVPPPQPHSLAVSTPGISASPLLAECISQDGNQANVPATSRTSATERPFDRLIRAVQRLEPKVLTSSVEDIGSVVSMIDRIAGSAPGNGSRTAVGEDLVAMTKCRLQARNFMSQDVGATAKKMKRHTSAMPLNNVSSAGSGNDSFKQLHGFESSELESTATSRIKRFKPEVNHTLLEEIQEINQRLIDTVVEVDDDADSVAAAASEGGEGTVVKCSYTAVALSPDLKAHFAAAQMSPIMPLRVLVPASYPKCSPELLDKLPVEPSGEFEDLSSKAKSKLSASLRGLSQPMSLGDMARTWDACTRKVILEYAQQHGGGSFSTTYGSWEYCLGTA